MQTISVSIPKDDSLKSQLGALYFTFKQITEETSCHFDLTKIKFVYPLLILPIAAYIRDTRSSFILPETNDVKSYFETIKFPTGTSSINEIQKVKHYIPLSFLSKAMPITEKEKFESCFENLLYKTVGEIPGIKNALYYPIGELIANMLQHSKISEGWLFAQIYQNKKFLDLCIVDRGRGLKKAYHEELNIQFSDEEAIEAAMKGLSIKPDGERGYGIRTSKRVVCEALGGSFLFLSGNSVLFSDNNRQRIAHMPEFNWQGVITAYRIPFPIRKIDIQPYVE